MTRLNMPLGRVQGFLLKAGLKPKVVEVRSKQIIFAQGELGQCRVLYSQGVREVHCNFYTTALRVHKHRLLKCAALL